MDGCVAFVAQTMVCEQLNIRITRRTKDILAHNARRMELTPAEYARSLLEKEERLYTGAEIDRRITRRLRRRKAVAA